MGNKPRDLVSGEVVLFHDLRADVGHIDHGEFEYSSAFLVNVMELCVDGFMRCRHSASAGLHVEKFNAGAVASMQGVHNAHILGSGFQQHSPASIAEDNAGGSVFVVDDR